MDRGRWTEKKKREDSLSHSYKSFVAQPATYAYLLRLGERRKNTKLMQFCNYTRLARSLPRPGIVEGCGGMPADTVALSYPSVSSSRTTREYLNFVSFPRRYSFIRAAAARPVINRRIQSPSVRNVCCRIVANLANARRILLIWPGIKYDSFSKMCSSVVFFIITERLHFY